jgi:polar amino acid transport system substrate-binding protein
MMIQLRILCFLYLFPLAVNANDSSSLVDTLSKKDKILLTVAIEEVGYFPYNYDDNGTIKGFSIDILKYFEMNSMYEFEFIILPWPRALHLVAQGKVDLLLTLFKKPERELTYHFIEPSFGYEANQLFSLTDMKIDFNGQLKQLVPFTIGTTREYSYGEYFDQANYLTKLPALTEDVLLKLLVSERIDLAISNPFTFNRLILDNQLENKVKGLKPYVEITPVYMALTKQRQDSKEISQKLGQLTKLLKSKPYYQHLLKKYKLDFKI